VTPGFADTTWVCLGVVAFAGLISLRTHYPAEETPDPPEYGIEEVRPVTRPEDAAPASTRLDDLMLVTLVMGLVACAVFVWLNLPRFVATG
jgi:hypothetical protein